MTKLRIGIMVTTLAVLAALGWRAGHRVPEPAPATLTLVTITEPTPPAPIVEAPKPVMKPPRRKPAPPPPDDKPQPPRVATPAPSTAPPRWTLPYSCERVRWYYAHFSPSTLETMRVAAGIAKPTGDQLRQVNACLAQK